MFKGEMREHDFFLLRILYNIIVDSLIDFQRLVIGCRGHPSFSAFLQVCKEYTSGRG